MSPQQNIVDKSALPRRVRMHPAQNEQFRVPTINMLGDHLSPARPRSAGRIVVESPRLLCEVRDVAETTPDLRPVGVKEVGFFQHHSSEGGKHVHGEGGWCLVGLDLWGRGKGRSIRKNVGAAEFFGPLRALFFPIDISGNSVGTRVGSLVCPLV